MTAEDWVQWFVLPAAIVAVGAAAIGGLLRRDIFAPSPVRNTGLVGFDLFLAMICYLLGAALAGAAVLAGGILPADTSLQPTPDQYANAMLVSQVMSCLPIFALLFVRLHPREAGWRQFGFGLGLEGSLVRTCIAAVVFSIAVVLALNVVAVWIGELFGYPEPRDGHETLRIIREAGTPLIRLKLCLAAVVAAPLIEEVMFRGILQTTLLDIVGRQRRWTVILIAAAMFAAVHVPAAQWQTLPGLLAFGVVLGWLYEKTGSLLPCILTHAAFNIVMIVLMIQIS